MMVETLPRLDPACEPPASFQEFAADERVMKSAEKLKNHVSVSVALSDLPAAFAHIPPQ